jgi:FkbM family methyltransferase
MSLLQQIVHKFARRIFPPNRMGRIASHAMYRVRLISVSRYTSRFTKYVPPKVQIGEIRINGNRRPLFMLGLDGDDYIARQAWCHGPDSYEYPLPKVLKRICYESRGVVIVGANTGFYVLQIAATSTAERIVAFEPYDRARDVLADNLRLNGLSDRVDVVAMAVGASCEEMEFVLPVPRFGTTIETSGTLEKGFHSNEIIGCAQKVHTTSLDAWSPTLSVPIDVIHLDVEGYEYGVLEGASETIERDRPLLFIEVLPCRDSAAQRLTEFCGLHGYSCFQMLTETIIETGQVIASKCSLNQCLMPLERIEQTLDVLREMGFSVERLHAECRS